MSIFLTIILVAIGLSMDTFSLSLSYGMLSIAKDKILKISISVGIFHFFMPIFGNSLNIFLPPINKNIIIGIIFLTISINIITSFFKEKEITPINSIFNIIMFSFAVSIDSFTVGVGLDAFLYPHVIVTAIFMLVSFLFTYTGLTLGNKINQRVGFISQIIGFLLLFILSIIYLFKGFN